MDVRGVRFSVPLGVVVSHILLQLGVQLSITVIQKQVSQVLLLHQVNDRLLDINCQLAISTQLELCGLVFQECRGVVAHSCLPGYLYPRGEPIIVACVPEVVILPECQYRQLLSYQYCCGILIVGLLEDKLLNQLE